MLYDIKTLEKGDIVEIISDSTKLPQNTRIIKLKGENEDEIILTYH